MVVDKKKYPQLVSQKLSEQNSNSFQSIESKDAHDERKLRQAF
jgi:hypothetical protein